MAEEVKGELEVFSALLLQNYIRIITAALYIKHENKLNGVSFKISKDNFAEMNATEIQAPLIGLNIQYNPDNEMLTSVPNEDFLKLYENKIMRDVTLKFYDDYRERYVKFICLIEN